LRDASAIVRPRSFARQWCEICSTSIGPEFQNVRPAARAAGLPATFGPGYETEALATQYRVITALIDARPAEGHA